ncbi:MAG: hypothetical protein MGAcid_13100 [uncultured Acidilobus sp. MG]|nr:MAG: hypothetical protein MGAcid_13100 [uncultured Acidilobus sp. MG]
MSLSFVSLASVGWRLRYQVTGLPEALTSVQLTSAPWPTM